MIHVLTSDKTSDRLPRLRNEMAVQDLIEYEDYLIWNGVHDKNSVAASINKSHKQIVHFANDNNLDEVTIIEDDIRFCGENAMDYYNLMRPESYDIWLGGIYLYDYNTDGTLNYFSGLHLYTVHKRFYNTFLSVNDNEHLDMALKGLGEYHVCKPYAAVQYNGFSTNTGKFENYDNLIKDQKFYNGFKL